MTYPKIKSIVNGVPKKKYLQSDLLNIVLETSPNMSKPIVDTISSIYKNSKITSRYVSSLDFFYRPAKIEERLTAFKTIAMELVIPMVCQALTESNISNNDIHKIVFVSSTGLIAPSIDLEIIKRLNLPPTCERSNVLFMGCAAGINGIKNACEYLNVEKNKNKNVLFVSIELSSMHIHFTEDINNIITHSIFSDGLSVIILSSSDKDVNDFEHVYVVDSFNYIIPDSSDGITLFIDENSISCRLSKDLPRYINEHILYALTLFLTNNKLTIEDIGFWAVHPGGKRILESVQNGLQLSADQLQSSWEVLDQYGNMLSSSIMFVLEKFKNTVFPKNKNDYIFCISFSFSPGVGIEFLLLKKILN